MYPESTLAFALLDPGRFLHSGDYWKDKTELSPEGKEIQDILTGPCESMRKVSVMDSGFLSMPQAGIINRVA